MMGDRLPQPETYGVACERIRCLCALYSASVTSNARTVKRNNLPHIKGSEISKHLIDFGCNAWDLVPDRLTDLNRLGDSARILGFYVTVKRDHVHTQSLPPGPDSAY